ncbi:MAG: hypothetical protein ACHQQQ_00750 [Bacteroidota bacterium]
MKCSNSIGSFVLHALLIIFFALVALRCHESLPTYVFPSNVIGIQVLQINQVSDQTLPPQHQLIHIRLTGQNIYDVVFQDSIDLKGTLRIWMEQNPTLYRTYTLTYANLKEKYLVHDGKMTLLPGQKFTMDFVWNLRTDDGIFVGDKMNMVRGTLRNCGPNIICTDPYNFIVESSLNVYDRLGVLTADPISFQLIVKICNICGLPPCPSPSGDPCDP